MTEVGACRGAEGGSVGGEKYAAVESDLDGLKTVCIGSGFHLGVFDSLELFGLLVSTVV